MQGRRNWSEYISLPFCLTNTSSSFNSTLSISRLQESFHHLVFCRPLRLFPGTDASPIRLNTCHSSLLFIIYSVIFFVTGYTYRSPHVFDSDLIFLCESPQPPQHTNIIKYIFRNWRKFYLVVESRPYTVEFMHYNFVLCCIVSVAPRQRSLAVIANYFRKVRW